MNFEEQMSDFLLEIQTFVRKAASERASLICSSCTRNTQQSMEHENQIKTTVSKLSNAHLVRSEPCEHERVMEG